MSVKSWRCPYCNQNATIRTTSAQHRLYEKDDCWISEVRIHTHHNMMIEAILCPNQECKQLSLKIELYDNKEIHNTLDKWQLCPESLAKLFPEYIPKAIRKDYQEACLIKDKSPKASATLARRCLQSMIRDFYNVKDKKTLKEEIDSIKNKVNSDVWEAIKTVKNIGNIGAHMEKDVNLIVDIEPEEVNKLIWLIEFLLKNWYIHREETKQKLKEIKEMGYQKKVDVQQKETQHKKTK